MSSPWVRLTLLSHVNTCSRMLLVSMSSIRERTIDIIHCTDDIEGEVWTLACWPISETALGLRAYVVLSQVGGKRADGQRVSRVAVESYRLVNLMGCEDEIPAKQQRSADPCSRHGHAGTSRKKVAWNKRTITAQAHRHRQAGISLESLEESTHPSHQPLSTLGTSPNSSHPVFKEEAKR